MPLADYAHHNEDASRIWWEEEGKHHDEDAERCREDQMEAEDAFAEELAELEDDDLIDLLADADYHARWPLARKCIEWEIKDRGLKV